MRMATKNANGHGALDSAIAQIKEILDSKDASFSTNIWICLTLLEAVLQWLTQNGLISRLAVEVQAQTNQGRRYVRTFALGVRKKGDTEESSYLKQSELEADE